MEKVSHELTNHLAALTDTCLIANRKGKKNLPLFLPYALFRALFLIKAKSIEIVHLGDALLAPLGVIIKSIYRLPVVSTVHGLDVTYPNRLYQLVVPACLKKLDKLICVSRHTMGECRKRGIPDTKCIVIPNGINPDEFYLAQPGSREKLQAVLKIDLADKLLLLSVGHLVARKGIPWFIRAVMPHLSRDTVYLIIGGHGNASRGNEKEVYARLIKDLKLEKQVFLLGEVSAEILRLAYNSADLLIMPNIKVPGDTEGLGMVALEAASCGLPVLASDLEGIKDAVKDGITGFLIEPYNAEGYIQKISSYRKQPHLRQRIRECTVGDFSWDRIALRYLKVFQTVVS
jgi:glycosyltransferase involved in cell wall biosynthesis